MISLSMNANRIKQTEQIRLPRVTERYPKRPTEHPVTEIVDHRNQLQVSCTSVKNRMEVHASPSIGEKNKSFLAMAFLSLFFGVWSFFMNFLVREALF